MVARLRAAATSRLTPSSPRTIPALRRALRLDGRVSCFTDEALEQLAALKEALEEEQPDTGAAAGLSARPQAASASPASDDSLVASPPSPGELALLDEACYRVREFDRFAVINSRALKTCATLAKREDWGPGEYVLRKTLSVQVAAELQEGNYVMVAEELIVRAGHLISEQGSALYLVFRRTASEPGLIVSPWRITRAARSIDLPLQLALAEPTAPTPLRIMVSPSEGVRVSDHARERFERLPPELTTLPPQLLVNALCGALLRTLPDAARITSPRGEELAIPVWLSRAEADGDPEVVAIAPNHSGPLEVLTLVKPSWIYARARAHETKLELIPVWLQRVGPDAAHGYSYGDGAPPAAR